MSELLKTLAIQSKLGSCSRLCIGESLREPFRALLSDLAENESFWVDIVVLAPEAQELHSLIARPSAEGLVASPECL